MAIETPQSTEPASVGEVVEFVKTYAKQETIGPLRNAQRWVVRGLAGAALLGPGCVLLILGFLRLFQTELDHVFGSESATPRGWSFVPYVAALVVCAVLLVVTVMQIQKTFLDKEDKQ